MRTPIAAIAGLIASAAFHPFHFWPAIFIGIGILYSLNKNTSTNSRIRSNLIFGIFFQILILHWIGTYVGSAAWITLVLMQAIFFIVLSFTTGAIAFALSWLLFEFILRSFPFGGFGWSRIGFVLTESPFNFLYPKVSIVGVAFIFVLIIGQIVERQFKGLALTAIFLLFIALLPNEVN